MHEVRLRKSVTCRRCTRRGDRKKARGGGFVFRAETLRRRGILRVIYTGQFRLNGAYTAVVILRSLASRFLYMFRAETHMSS